MDRVRGGAGAGDADADTAWRVSWCSPQHAHMVARGLWSRARGSAETHARPAGAHGACGHQGATSCTAQHVRNTAGTSRRVRGRVQPATRYCSRVPVLQRHQCPPSADAPSGHPGPQRPASARQRCPSLMELTHAGPRACWCHIAPRTGPRTRPQLRCPRGVVSTYRVRHCLPVRGMASLSRLRLSATTLHFLVPWRSTRATIWSSSALLQARRSLLMLAASVSAPRRAVPEMNHLRAHCRTKRP